MPSSNGKDLLQNDEDGKYKLKISSLLIEFCRVLKTIFKDIQGCYKAGHLKLVREGPGMSGWCLKIQLFY